MYPRVLKKSYRALANAGVACVGLALCSVAWSATYFVDGPKTIKSLAVQGTYFYVGFVEPTIQSCQYGFLYISADRKAIYAHLLASKIAGKRLSRVDYSQPNGNGTVCYVELVEIED